MKRCPKCEKEKEPSEFNKDKSRKDGRTSYCRQCHREHKELKKIYGLSMDEYNQILLEQGGVCAICGGNNNGKTLQVDHDHVTDMVRGLLCIRCNTALGLMGDDMIVVQRMYDYLSPRRMLELLGGKSAGDLYDLRKNLVETRRHWREKGKKMSYRRPGLLMQPGKGSQ